MKKVGAVDYEIEMPGRRQERKIYYVNLMKSGMLWHLTQTVLLAADLEPMEDANESGSTEHQSWSGEIADWEHLSAEQFFPLEDSGFQDLILDVPEPQRAVKSGPFVLSKCDN